MVSILTRGGRETRWVTSVGVGSERTSSSTGTTRGNDADKNAAAEKWEKSAPGTSPADILAKFHRAWQAKLGPPRPLVPPDAAASSASTPAPIPGPNAGSGSEVTSGRSAGQMALPSGHKEGQEVRQNGKGTPTGEGDLGDDGAGKSSGSRHPHPQAARQNRPEKDKYEEQQKKLESRSPKRRDSGKGEATKARDENQQEGAGDRRGRRKESLEDDTRRGGRIRRAASEEIEPARFQWEDSSSSSSCSRRKRRGADKTLVSKNKGHRQEKSPRQRGEKNGKSRSRSRSRSRRKQIAKNSDRKRSRKKDDVSPSPAPALKEKNEELKPKARILTPRTAVVEEDEVIEPGGTEGGDSQHPLLVSRAEKKKGGTKTGSKDKPSEKKTDATTERAASREKQDNVATKERKKHGKSKDLERACDDTSMLVSRKEKLAAKDKDKDKEENKNSRTGKHKRSNNLREKDKLVSRDAKKKSRGDKDSGSEQRGENSKATLMSSRASKQRSNQRDQRESGSPKAAKATEARSKGALLVPGAAKVDKVVDVEDRPQTRDRETAAKPKRKAKDKIAKEIVNPTDGADWASMREELANISPAASAARIQSMTQAELQEALSSLKPKQPHDEEGNQKALLSKKSKHSSALAEGDDTVGVATSFDKRKGKNRLNSKEGHDDARAGDSKAAKAGKAEETQSKKRKIKESKVTNEGGEDNEEMERKKGKVAVKEGKERGKRDSARKEGEAKEKTKEAAKNWLDAKETRKEKKENKEQKREGTEEQKARGTSSAAAVEAVDGAESETLGKTGERKRRKKEEGAEPVGDTGERQRGSSGAGSKTGGKGAQGSASKRRKETVAKDAEKKDPSDRGSQDQSSGMPPKGEIGRTEPPNAPPQKSSTSSALPFTKDQKVQYFSSSFGRWIPCKVIDVDEQKHAVQISSKVGYWFKGADLVAKLRPAEEGAAA